MSRYLLDSNHASELMVQTSPLAARVARTQVSSFHLPMPVVGELWYMVLNSTRVTENAARLERLLQLIAVEPFDLAAAREFGQVRSELRRKGRPIPPIDVQIAAISRVGGFMLLTADAHFGFINGLQREDWLA